MNSKRPAEPLADKSAFSKIKFALALLSFLLYSLTSICQAEQATGAGEKRIDIKKLTILEQQKKVKRQSPADTKVKANQTDPKKATRLKRLQKGIEAQKNKVLQSRKKEQSLLFELESIDHNLLIQQTELTSLNRKYNDQEQLLEFKQRDLERVTADKETIKVHVRKRLSAYYQMGSVGLMNVIFSAKTLPELLSFQEYFHKLLQYDQAAIDSYLVKIDELNRAREVHAREKKRLINLVDKVEKEKDQLAETYQDKTKLLTRVNTEKNLYLQAVSEIEEAAANLSRTLDKIKEKPVPQVQAPPKKTDVVARVISAKTGGSKKITDLKGWLEPPVYGTVVTSFGISEGGKFGINTFANGIDIKADEGTEIRAIFGGKIIHSAYLRGYGNLIIIDHGEQYYSLVSRVGKLNKKEGTSVKRGEVIGIVGKNAALIGEGLHFEIRHGSTPENPMQWLNNAGLKIKATRNRIK